MKALQKKIREVEEQFAEEKEESIVSQHSQDNRDKAMKILGGMLAVDQLHKNISSHISSEMIKALIIVQKEKLYLYYGFERFVDFLQKSNFALPNKTEFYSRKELLEVEGETRYEIFNEAKIPISTRKLLANRGESEIFIEGNEIIIDGERSDLSDLQSVKLLINDFANDNKKLLDAQKQKQEKIEKLEKSIETGAAEFEELRRAFDAAGDDGSPYNKALMKLLGAFVAFNTEVGNLTLIEKEKNAETALDTLWVQINICRRNFLRDDHRFEDVMNPATDISPAARELLSADDDWGDELEQ